MSFHKKETEKIELVARPEPPHEKHAQREKEDHHDHVHPQPVVRSLKKCQSFTIFEMKNWELFWKLDGVFKPISCHNNLITVHITKET